MGTAISYAQSNNQTLYLNQDGQATLDVSGLELCFPTSPPCTPTYAQGDDHAIWLSNNSFPGSSTDFRFDTGSAEFTELSDGTATIVGTIYNTTNATDKWEVKLYLSSKMNWSEWSALGRSYKDERGLAGNNYLNWSYYTADPNTTSELIGVSGNAGKTLSIEHMPSNYYYGFQVGIGANNKNADYGLSGWFNYSWDGMNFHQGDFNLDLANCSPPSIDDCLCEGKMQNFSFTYTGVSGVTVQAFKKDGSLLKTFNNVNNGDKITVEGFDFKGRLDAKTTIQVVGGTAYEIHTSCSEQIIGNVYGPFKVISYTDGDGNYCDGGSDLPVGAVTINVDKQTFSCDDLGDNLVTMTATDAEGNTCTQEFTVTIEDNIAPTVVTKDIARVIGANGQVTISANDVLNFNCGGGTSEPEPVPGDGEVTFEFATCTSDNCSITSKTLDKYTFDCNDIGVNTVTVTVTDQSGNTTTATATLTITDNQAPTVIAQDITIPLDADGIATITPEMINNGSNDGCGDITLTLSKTTFDCNEVGPNTVTLIATDESGNTSTTTATVTVVDDLAPEVVTQNILIYLDENGNGKIRGTDILYICEGADVNVPDPVTPPTSGGGRGGRGGGTPTPTVDYSDIIVTSDVSQFTSCTADNCSIVNATLSKNTFNCSDIGDVSIMVTVTDSHGNVSTGMATVTVADNTPPTVTTQDVALSLDAAGNATLTVDQVEVESADNCTIDSKVLSQSTFSCDDTGVNQVTLTVTDNSGNQTVNTFNVTITDDITPTVVAQDVTVSLNNDGLAAITLQDVDNGSFDNCNLTLALDRFSFNCTDVGQHTVTLTGTDPSGNTASATATVTVVDNTLPTAIAQNFEVFLNQDGVASITPTQVDNGSNDNCGIASITLDRDAFGCGDLGAQTVTLTVTDVNGNVSTASATITVTDNIAPTVVTKDIARVIGANGQVTISANDVLNFNCGGGTSEPVPVPGDGEVTFEFATCTSDNCTITSKVLDKYTFDCNDIGVNTVTVTVTDQSGNTTTATATLTITDNQAPTVIAQDITIPLDADGIATITPEMINNGSNDGCGDITLTLSKTTFDCNEVGPNTVTLIATDESGNTSTTTATVTVVDDLAPEVVTQNILIYLDENGNGKIRGTDILYICEGADVNVPDPVTPPTSGGGRGGRGGGTPTPTVDYSDIVVTSDVGQFTSCTADNCKITVATLSKNTFNCTNIGNNVVTVTVKDAEGNTTTATAIVTVIDNRPPTVTTQDVALNLDASGNATLTVDQVEVESADNCTIDSKVLSQSTFSCDDTGVNQVTLTVTDNSGNQTVNTFNVTITDDITPTVVAQDVTVILDNNGLGAITLQEVDNGSFDNCNLTLALDRFSFNCTDVGQHTVTLTGTDPSGNTASATATVTVVDNTLPTAIAQNFEVFLNQDGVVSITPTQVDNGSNDNCGIASITLDRDTFGCGDLGQQTVTLTVTDTNGNSSTAVATITVTDNIAPTVVTKDIARVIGPSGQVTISANDVLDFNCGGGTSIPQPVPGDGEVTFEFATCTSDNCTITSKVLDKYTFDCNDIGVNTVTVTVTDQSGNTTTATTTLTITDNQAPTVIAQDITIPLGVDGIATITPEMISNGSNDGCGDITLTLSKTTFDCNEVGPNTVTLIATDESGNTATTTATVTVVDDLAPEVVTQNILIYLDENGNGKIRGTDVLYICEGADVNVPDAVTPPANNGNGRGGRGGGRPTTPTVDYSDVIVTSDVSQFTSCTSDNCSIVNATLSKTTFDCSDIGDVSVMVTVTDSNGNISTGMATVTVADNTPPTLTTQDVALSLDASGNATLTIDQVEVESADNCTINSKVLSQSTFSCDDTGVNQVTLTVTDNSGNQTVNTFNVTITDDITPTVVAQDVTVILDNNGLGAITLQEVDNGSFDNCNLTLALDRFSFNCTDVGQHTVTLTGTDPSGNTASATATVTVVDNTLPTAIAQNFEVFLNQDGVVSITPTQVDNGSNDNCGIASITLDRDTFGCGDLGQQTVTLTVTDTNGNSSTAVATITVTDNIAPTVVTKDIARVIGPSGQVTISANDVLDFNCGGGTSIPQPVPGDGEVTFEFATCTSDNCTITSKVLDKYTFDCNDIGVNTVTVTVTDQSGNTTTATTTLTITDNQAPTVIAQDITIPLGVDGIATITPEMISNGSNDGCGDITLTLSKTTFDCNEVGPNTVTLIATDESGNTATTTATVTVVDDLAPEVVTQNILIYLDENGNGKIRGTDVLYICEGADVNVPDAVTPPANNGNGRGGRGGGRPTTPTVDYSDVIVTSDVSQFTSCTSDNCSIVNATLSKTTFDCSDIGDVSVMVTVTDSNGNISTGMATVTVADNTPPTLTTQDVALSLDASGNATLTIDQVEVESADNCTINSKVLSQSTFSCDDTGVNQVTLTVTDNSGNQTVNTFNVTITDDITPTVVAQDVTVILDNNGLGAITLQEVDNGSFDNCNLTLALDRFSFNCTDVGQHTVTLTGTDPSGNTASATATVTVVDNTLPTAIAQNFEVFLNQDGVVSITPTQVDNGSNDNCGIASITLDREAFGCGDLGQQTVTLTVTDTNGNSSTANAIITVTDNIAPTVIAQDVTVVLDQNGTASITIPQVDNGSSDNCNLTLSLDKLAFDCSDLGTNTVTLTGTDASGNTATATATATVIDNIAPTAIAQDVSISINENGVASITADQINNGSTDNCGVATVTIDQTNFDCSNIGANTVTLTVTDNAGNTSTASATVTIVDNVAPIVIAQNVTVALDQNGTASITIPQVDNGSFDNCNLTLSLDKLAFDCSDLGTNTVTLTGTDNAGNTSTATANVTVIDNTAPSVVTQNISVNLEANGLADVSLNQVVVSTSDNCEIVSQVLSKTSFDCSNVGSNTIILTVTDGSGNTTTDTIEVNIIDNIVPTVIAQDVTLILDQNGTASITIPQVDNGSSDNCNLTLSLDKLAFDCSDLGTNTVTLTGTDNAGNTATATATVTVIDNTAPVVVTQNATISIDATGTAQLTTALIEVSSTDNCEIVSKILSQTSFDCSDLGANTVTYTLTDGSGNSTTETVTVTIVDNTAPIVMAQDVTVALDQNGTASITIPQVDSGSSDNCDLTLSLDKLAFDCSDLGTNTVTLTGTDASGNTAAATATVTVIDNIAPTAIAQNLEISIDENGVASITADQINNGSTDNCGIATITIDQTNFDCSNTGENTVTLTVTDNAGNTSTATAIVTIIDTAAPVITTQPASVSLDENGEATITPSDVVVAATQQRDVKHFGGNSSHAIYLSKYTPDNQVGRFHFVQTVGSLSQLADGTATVTGTIVNINDANDSWAVQLNLIDKKSWNEWSDLGRSWKGNAGNVQDNYLDWDFYIMDTNPSNPSTLTGLGNNAGKTKTLAHAPANLNYGFQVGKAANDKDTDLGFSGWFTYQNDKGNTVQGDFNLDITRTYYTVGDGPCATAEVTISESEFNCTDIGQQTVTITATDNQGNTITETTTVTVIDDIAPTVVAQNVTVYLDENGTASITIPQVDNGSSDNCDLTLSLDKLVFDCNDLGTNTVTLTGTDASGNTAAATATVTVIDNIAPTAIAKDLTVYLDEHGNASISANQINNGSSDNCGISSVTINQTNLDCTNLGENLITLTTTDISGNASTAISTVTVVDNIAPVITGTPSNIVYNETDTDCGQVISWSAPQAADNCTVTLTSTHNPGETFPVGTTTVTYTATDLGGNSVNSSFDVTIVALPISISLNAEVYNDAEGYNVSCYGASDGNITATVEGGCSPYTYSWSNGTTGNSISNLTAGDYTLTVTDGNGTTSSQTISLTEPSPITMETNVSPALPGGDAGVPNTIYLGYGEQSVTLGAAAIGGNGEFTYTWSSDGDISCVDGNSAVVAPKITTNYQVTATDSNGCSVERSFTIYVVDVRCEGGIVNENPNGPNDGDDDDNHNGGDDDDDDNHSDDDDDKGKDDDDDDKGKDDDDDDNDQGDNDDITACQCEGKMQNFTVTYTGISGVTIKAYKKNSSTLIKRFNNVQNGDQLTVDGFDSKGRLDSKTYLRVGSKYYMIHTSCSENIAGQSFGPFKVDAYTDGEGSVCMAGIGNVDTGDDDDDKDKDDDDDDKGKDDDDDDKSKDDDDDDKGKDDKKDDDDDDSRAIIASDNNDPVLLTYGGQSGNVNLGCDCEGGMKNITVVYNGTSGTWIKAYNRWGNVTLGEYKYVQDGQTITINGYGNYGLLDSKTYLKVGAYLYKIYTSCYVDIVGKSFGPFTVTGFTDKKDNTCSINDTPDVVEVESTCDATSYSNNGHALWLSQYSSQGNAQYLFENGFGTLSRLEDGKATVTGTVYNKHDPSDKWEIEFYLAEGKNWSEWSALGRSYKDEQNIAGSAYQDWTYHILDVTKVNKLVGKGSNEGEEKIVSHMPSNYQYGFQIGNKANSKNANYGISGWFFYRNDSGNWVQGDINMDLTNCDSDPNGTGDCDLDIISWSGNVTLCYQGESICVSQEEAAALIADGAKLGSCAVILPSARAPKGIAITPDVPAMTNSIEVNAYPNPTSDRTTITFKPSVSGPTTVNVYNSQGHLIGELFADDTEANKTYSIEFNGAQQISGLYMIRVNMSGFIETKKLIIKH